MGAVITFLRLGLLTLSLLGLISALNRKIGLPMEFGPAVACAGISSVMFIAGLLNIFLIAVYGILLTGLACLLLYGKAAFYKNRRGCVVIALWMAALAYFALLYKGSHFVSYDNFSHWATVVKDMLIENRMPNFQDSLIYFQAYPLGSSLFIYFVCRIIGLTDACYLVGHMMLNISFLTCLLVFVKRRRILSVTVPLFAIYALVSFTPIYYLQVDTVMPLAAVALFCMITFETGEASRSERFLSQTPYICIYIFLVNVKNSGIFFVLICWAYWLIRSAMLHRSKKAYGCFALSSVLPSLGALLLWKRHVSLVFVSGETSKHAMSLENFSAVFAGKTAEDIRQIGSDVLRQAFSIQTRPFQILLIASALLLVLVLQRAVRKGRLCPPILSLVGIWAVWGLYVVSVFGMYIFSMPLLEASTLSSFERYMTSAAVFILGISLVLVLRYLRDDKLLWTLPVIALFLLPVFIARKSLPQLYEKQVYETTDRYAFQCLAEEDGVQSNRSYFIYRSNDDAGYLYFLARYEFWSANVYVATSEDFADVEDNVMNYDYLIIWDQDETIQQFLADAGLSAYISDGRAAIPLS